MKNFLIYIVAIAILALVGVDGYFVYTRQASTQTIVEFAVGVGALLAWAAVSFAHVIGGIHISLPSFRRKPKPGTTADDDQVTLSDINEKVGDLSSSVESVQSDVSGMGETLDSLKETVNGTLDGLKETVDGIKETVEANFGQAPEGFVATINTEYPDGKLHKVYDLPVSDSYEDALEDARKSLEARQREGQPVLEPKITVVPVYSC